MSVIAAKFGGSSLCSPRMFRAVFDIVSARAGRKYIVLSAPGKRFAEDLKVTDLLLAAHEAAPPRDQSIFSHIYDRYASIRDALCPAFDLEGECAEILRRLHASRDYAASRGEYLCAKLFAAAFSLKFIDAAEILFFDADGKIDRDASFRAMQSRLSDCERAVIPGFYAASPDGIKLFPRGGSDVTGAWVAAAMHADIYENWTDVSGVFSADPTLVPSARRHERISARQMRQMALAGANVLHPDALLPLIGGNIDICVKNTLCPNDGGTRVSERIDEYVPAVVGAKSLYFNQSDLRAAVPVSASAYALKDGVSVISVFGANESAYRELHAKYERIHIIHMPEHIQIITTTAQYQTALEAIHQILLKNCPNMRGMA